MWLAILFLYLQLSPTFAIACPPGGVFDPSFNKVRHTNGATLSAYWIGTTNETADYTNWAPGEPLDPSVYECGSTRTDGTSLWKKELCYSTRPFVCTTDPSSVPATLPPSDPPCDPGYSQYGDKCYRIFKGFIRTLNYYYANIFCLEKENATLPKIPSLAVQNFLYSFIFPANSDIWLGLTCGGTDGINRCWWGDNSHPTYTNYQPGEPQGAYPVVMTVSNGQWHSGYDFRQFASVVVCEKPARA